MNKIHKILLYTLGAVLSREPIDDGLFRSMNDTEWEELYNLSKSQGVTALIFDAISVLPVECQPPRSLKMRWIAITCSIENHYELQYAKAVDFAELMDEHGVQTIVLKGLAFGSYYPRPEHRECGDLDCFLPDRFDEGNLIASRAGAKINSGDYKHAHINYRGLTIENHKFFTNFNATHTGKRTERLLQKYIQENRRRLNQTHLQIPSADFNAFFLIKHALRHFIDDGITVRHVADWATFLQAEQNNVDWLKVYTDMTRCRIRQFADILTAIGIRYLNLKIENRNISFSSKHSLIEKVIHDILGTPPLLEGESFWKKVLRILRRFKRMWIYRNIADEKIFRLIWNSFAFSSYMHRTPKL